jgi:DNA-binding beta-propeller fold protein YncE
MTKYEETRALKKFATLFMGMLIAVGGLTEAQAQISTKQQQAEQDAVDAKTPKLNYKEEVLQLIVPGMTMGETVGVDVNSQNHIFVYSRTNPQGIARGGTAAMLWEFDPNGKFIKEWGPHNYAASFAHSVRVDKNDNVWQVDEGSGMIVKYNPQAVPIEQFGRTPEAIDYLEASVEKQGRGFEGEARREEHPVEMVKRLHPDGGVGTFNRPTDVAWDSAGNVFVTDGYGNSRVVKIAPGGHWLKWVGTWGTGPNQFNIVHSVAVDSHDNIYAADRNNHRIQVYDDNLNFEKSITGIGAPWGVCIPKADASGKQYIFSSDGTSGRLYKIDLGSGKVVGWAQTSLGRGEDDAGRLVHEIGCKDPNVVYLGSAILWNVTKVTIQ